MHAEGPVASRMLKAGASGYITKDSEPEHLLAALRKVAAGGRYIGAELAQQLAFGNGAGRPLHELLSDRERSEERRVGKECRSLCDWSSDVCSSDLCMRRARSPRGC